MRYKGRLLYKNMGKVFFFGGGGVGWGRTQPEFLGIKYPGHGLSLSHVDESTSIVVTFSFWVVLIF